MVNQTQRRHWPVCHTWLMTVQCVTNIFHFLALGANPWAKVHQNRRWPATHPGLPSCQISSPCINPRQGYPLQTSVDKQRQKQTMKDISPACLSACGIIMNKIRKQKMILQIIKIMDNSICISIFLNNTWSNWWITKMYMHQTAQNYNYTWLYWQIIKRGKSCMPQMT